MIDHDDFATKLATSIAKEVANRTEEEIIDILRRKFFCRDCPFPMPFPLALALGGQDTPFPLKRARFAIIVGDRNETADAAPVDRDFNKDPLPVVF